MQCMFLTGFSVDVSKLLASTSKARFQQVNYRNNREGNHGKYLNSSVTVTPTYIPRSSTENIRQVIKISILSQAFSTVRYEIVSVGTRSAETLRRMNSSNGCCLHAAHNFIASHCGI